MTINVADDRGLMAKQFAARHGITLRSLIERGLHLAMVEDASRTEFELEDRRFGSKGSRSPYFSQDWASIREAIYEGRCE